MTLKDILARLERIERVQAFCYRCDIPLDRQDEKAEAIAELRRDIEQFLIRTEGTLTP